MAGNRLVFIALALLAGCGGDKGGKSATDNPNRDLQRPAVDANSPLNDEASKGATPKSSRPAAGTAAKSAKPMTRTLASGTAIAAKFDAGISSRTHKAGQKLTGTVAADVKDKNGYVVIPAGSKVHLTISAIHESERKSDKTGKLVLTPNKVVIGGRSYPLSGSAVALDRTLKDRKTNAGDLAKVGVGAGAGALLGTAVSGGSTKGAVIGGVAGAAVGTQRAVETQDRDVVVPEGSRLKVTLKTAFRRSI
jgi:type IV secretory pathway VirB10-like protein